MSVQFGRWNFEGPPPEQEYMAKVTLALAPWGPDSDEEYSEGGAKILYCAFNTTKEARREIQPHTSLSGAVITWDGRLDNRAELIRELRDLVTSDSTDVAIVSAAYEKFRTACFAKLIGDWALSIWNPNKRLLILAKDPFGTRHLYYSIEGNHVVWSTVLDPLVRFAEGPFSICEEYIAGWLSYFPAAHLTPYVGIHSVPPSSFVLVQPGRHRISEYWNFDSRKRVRYRTDAEYEEHFRTVFAQAVQRRLRSDGPILSELSGGMDSSSIVCMSDTIIASGAAETPRLDTISWYDDADPNLDGRTYVTRIEEKRGRTGWHIDLGDLKQREVDSQTSFTSDFEDDRFAANPFAIGHLPEPFQQYAKCMKSCGYRVVLSGLGGDSATGSGVPTPTPELQNLLARARFIRLARQLKAWAVKMQKPRLPLLWDAVRDFFPLGLTGTSQSMRSASWLLPDFVRRNRAALSGYPSRVKLFGPLPSFQHSVSKANGERRMLASGYSGSDLRRELRYPYLDRDFLEFMYAVPREQVVRVGQRRSLMRRALIGIVPNEVLKPRKTVVPQPPRCTGSLQRQKLGEIANYTVTSCLGIIDPKLFWAAALRWKNDEDVPVESLVRTLTIEFWLRHLMIHGVITGSGDCAETRLLIPHLSGDMKAHSPNEFS